MTVSEQIQAAWQQLEDGAAIEELRRNWDRLTGIRRDLDDAVVALAVRIEQLRVAAQQPEAEAEPADDDTAGGDEGLPYPGDVIASIPPPPLPEEDVDIPDWDDVEDAAEELDEEKD